MTTPDGTPPQAKLIWARDVAKAEAFKVHKSTGKKADGNDRLQAMALIDTARKLLDVAYDIADPDDNDECLGQCESLLHGILSRLAKD